MSGKASATENSARQLYLLGHWVKSELTCALNLCVLVSGGLSRQLIMKSGERDGKDKEGLLRYCLLPANAQAEHLGVHKA